jgi:hypothetical protein
VAVVLAQDGDQAVALQSSTTSDGTASNGTEVAGSAGVAGALTQGQAKVAKTEQEIKTDGRIRGGITAVWAGLFTGAVGGPLTVAIIGGAALDKFVQQSHAENNNVVLGAEDKKQALIEGGILGGIGWAVMPQSGGAAASAGSAAPAEPANEVEELAEVIAD